MRLLQVHLAVIRDEKVSPFVKLEIVLPVLWFLLEPLTKNHCMTWSSMINLWIDSTYRILLSSRQRSSNYLEHGFSYWVESTPSSQKFVHAPRTWKNPLPPPPSVDSPNKFFLSPPTKTLLLRFSPSGKIFSPLNKISDFPH